MISFSNRTRILWNWLTEPADAVQGSERRRRARLLLSLLVILIPATILGVIVRAFVNPVFIETTLQVPVATTVMLLAAYGLGRTRYTGQGAVLAVGTIFVSVFWAAGLAPRFVALTITLNFLATVMLLASLVFSLRATILAALVGVAGVLLLPLLIPGVAFRSILTALTFLILMSLLIVAAAAIRDRDWRQLERRSRGLALLNRVSRAASISLEPVTVLEVACRELALAFGVPQAGAALLRDDGTAVTVVAEYHAKGSSDVLGQVIPVDGNPATSYVLEHKEPLVVVDAQHDPRMAAVHDLMQQRGVASILILPLVAHNRVVGAVGLDTYERREFSDEEIELAVNAVAVAARTWEHAQLFAAEREARRLSDTLSEIAQELNLAPDLETALDLILAHTERVIALDSGSIMLLEGQEMRVVAVRGFDLPEEVLGTRLDLDLASLNRQVIESRRPLIVASVAGNARWRKSAQASGLAPHLGRIHSWLGVPLLIRERVIGMLTADKVEVNFYTERDAELALAFAGQAAVAIENARLHDRAQRELAERRRVEEERERLLADLERRSKHLQTAAQVSKSASTILDPRGLMNRVVNLIQERFDFYYVGIFLVGESAKYVVLQAGSGKTGRKMLAAGHKLLVGGDSMIGWCVAHAQSCLTQNRHENSFLPETCSEAAIPLISRGRCIGGLTVQSTEAAAFADEDVAVLQAMADQLAVVIENAWLYEAAQREIAARKRAEAEIQQLYEDLERRVTERTTELAAVNQELEAFAYSVSHDLRAPLRRISSFSQVLQEDHADQLDAGARDYLQRMDAASQQMWQLIDALLNLSRISRREMHRESVDLEAMAREVAAELQSAQPERRVEFEVAEGLAADGDARLLRIVLENLLGNAWKFTAGRSPARIQVGVLQKDGEAAFFVRDDGAGFDMTYAAYLFMAFRRLHTTDEYEGTGIGLATVQRIIHRHGGRVWAESELGRGATFYFSL